jgi:hypothetical protein
MELKEFIATTLAEIQQGVQAAIASTSRSGTSGVINPCWGTVNDIDKSHIQFVQFDVAVTVSDKTTTSAQGGISVVGIKIGGDGSLSAERSNVSRIQFAIPVVPPVTTVDNARVAGEPAAKLAGAGKIER